MNRADLRNQIRQRADMVGSLFISDTLELNPWIDDATGDLYDFLARSYGDTKYAKSEWINVGPLENNVEGSTDPAVAWPKLGTALTATSYGGYVLSAQLTADQGVVSKYTLPDDFQRLVRVHFVPGYVEKTSAVNTPSGMQYGPEWRLVASQSEFFPLEPMDLTGRVVDMRPVNWLQTTVNYRLHCGPHRIVFGALDQNGDPVGSDSRWIPNAAIDFLPVPQERYAVQVFYVPKPHLLSNDTELFAYEHDEWVICECAARCLEKQRSPEAATARQSIERVKERIRNWSQTKDASNPPMMSLHGGAGSTNPGRRRGRQWP